MPGRRRAIWWPTRSTKPGWPGLLLGFTFVADHCAMVMTCDDMWWQYGKTWALSDLFAPQAAVLPRRPELQLQGCCGATLWKILWSVWHQEFERTGLVTVTRWLDSPCVCWTFYVFSRNDQQEVSTRVRPAVERPKPPTQGPKAWVKCAKEGGCWINHPHSSYTAFCCWFLERSRASWKLLFVDEVCKPLLVFLSYSLVFVCSRRVVVRDSAIVHFC